MKPEITEKIEALLNKTFDYKGKEITITSYKEVRGQIVLFKENENLFGTFNYEQFQAFLNQLKELGEKEVLVPTQQTFVEMLPQENVQMKKSLLEMLELVKKDKAYTPQAQAVCNIANAMVNIQKTELQIIQAIKKNKN